MADQQQPAQEQPQQEQEPQQIPISSNKKTREPELPTIVNQLPSSDESSSSSSDEEGRKKKKVSRRKNTAKSEDEVVLDERKPRLPSAEEIYNRIKWDYASVEDVDNFGIGYEDRFDGIKTVPFTEFELGVIPMHRIRQYTHMDKIVWDRTTRFINLPAL